MAGLFANGTAADIIIVVILAEAVWLRLHRAWPVMALLCRLMPGLLMMLALRAALTGQDWLWIALPLTLSFPFHLVDVWSGAGKNVRL